VHLLLLPILLLKVAGQPATSSIDKEMEEIRSAIPGDAACANTSEDDMRPYTLCLAETWFNDAVAEMDRQLKVTLAHVEATRGVRAVDRLANEQLNWTKRRDSKCEEEMAGSPVTQVARNTLGCQTICTEERTAHLKALAVAK
jgi:uncharacterized protein YecT (DUF1311 family)